MHRPHSLPHPRMEKDDYYYDHSYIPWRDSDGKLQISLDHV